MLQYICTYVYGNKVSIVREREREREREKRTVYERGVATLIWDAESFTTPFYAMFTKVTIDNVVKYKLYLPFQMLNHNLRSLGDILNAVHIK